MKNKRLTILMAGLIASMSLFLPACGSKNNNPSPIAQPPFLGQNCIPGQICNNPILPGATGGMALTNGPTFSSLDDQGSAIVLNFGAQGGNGYTGNYNGSVVISGTIHLVPGSCYMLPPGDYPVQGQGMWVAGYAGSVAGLQAQLQMANGGAIYISSAQIRAGQDPMNPQQGAGFMNYMQGIVSVSACGRNFTAL